MKRDVLYIGAAVMAVFGLTAQYLGAPPVSAQISIALGLMWMGVASN